MRILDADDVTRLLDMSSCIRAVEAAFRARGEGSPTPSAMIGLDVGRGSVHAKMAALDLSRRYVAAKMNANFPANPVEYGLPTIQGILVLFDGTNGAPLAVMDSASITTLRTAAASAVAASWLARPNASTVTFVGCGVQARAHLTALRCVRPIVRVLAVDERPVAAMAFCQFAMSGGGISATAAATVAEATRASDIVVTSTPSRTAILHVGDLNAGVFVAAVGADNEHKQEISAELLRASVVIVDDLDQCARYGDLHHAVVAGSMRPDDVRASLDAVVAGRRSGRLDDEEIIIFDSTGIALEDVAAAATIFERLPVTTESQNESLRR